MDQQQKSELVQAALQVRQHAFAPHSGFAVGAALRTSDGQLFVGCNVENDSYGLTICAERAAVASAVASGHRQYEAIAIAAAGGLPPCGACRQVLAQFCDDLTILLVDADQSDRVCQVRLKDLMPDRFHLKP